MGATQGFFSSKGVFHVCHYQHGQGQTSTSFELGTHQHITQDENAIDFIIACDVLFQDDVHQKVASHVFNECRRRTHLREINHIPTRIKFLLRLLLPQ